MLGAQSPRKLPRHGARGAVAPLKRMFFFSIYFVAHALYPLHALRIIMNAWINHHIHHITDQRGQQPDQRKHIKRA